MAATLINGSQANMGRQEKLLDTNAISDNEVIAMVLGGEKERYALLVRRYNQRLYRIGMAILNDDPEVEDIMQTTYLKAYENLKKFGFRSAFSTWLTRIMINECLLRLRRKQRSAGIEAEISKTDNFQLNTNDTQTPVMKTMNAELKQILERAIRDLPVKYKTVFIMREIEGMNIDETKNSLQISEANVKVRLNRAKALLKESLLTHYKREDILHFHLTQM